jgi:glycosyltransferase involved in cell wall biosynthesis
MQTAIYTIAKNEAHNVAAFMKAADGAPVYVLDTGSTDDTVNLLKQHGANVEQQVITPWRFDTARNVALEMVPSNTDVCVSLDMDEVIEQGWQTKLKEQWHGNIGNYKYIAEWKDEAKTIPAVTAPRTRLHARQGFEWHRKIHEVIRPLPGVQLQDCDTDIWVRHYQDGKQRHYSGALDELIADNPNDVDAWLQRAGEMFQKKQWAKALVGLHLCMCELWQTTIRPVALQPQINKLDCNGGTAIISLGNNEWLTVRLFQPLRLKSLTAVKPGAICPYYFSDGQYTFGLRCGDDGLEH